MITRERIEALRADHGPVYPEAFPKGMCKGCEGDFLPCDTYAALTLALEAETLRTALEPLVAERPNCWGRGPTNRCGRCDWCVAEAALGGTE